MLYDLIPQSLRELLEPIKAEKYLVGGAVRDYCLGMHNISDWDFVIFCDDMANHLAALAKKFDITFIELDAENGHYRMVHTADQWQADFARPRGFDIKSDLEARDFTINAIAFNLQSKEIVDPLQGIADLQSKVIRQISDASLDEDILRCYRAYRCAAMISGIIDPGTIANIQRINKENTFLESIAAERICYEINKLMECNNSYAYINMMFDAGLFQNIIPELAGIDRVPRNTHHHLPLREHTLELISQYENKVQCKSEFSEYTAQLTSHRAILKWAFILHDIAKPETWEIQGEKHTFYQHDVIGAEHVERIGEKLRWSREMTNAVAKLVRYHLAPFQITPLDQDPQIKTMNKVIRKMDNYFVELIALAWADMFSVRGPMMTDEVIARSEHRLSFLLEHYVKFMELENKEPPLIQGNQLEALIKEVNLPRTKLIKELLNDLRDLQSAGIISSFEDAREWFIKEGKERVARGDA